MKVDKRQASEKANTNINTLDTTHTQHVQPLVYSGLIFTGFVMICFW